MEEGVLEGARRSGRGSSRGIVWNEWNGRRSGWNGGSRWSVERSGGTEWGKVPLRESAIERKCH